MSRGATPQSGVRALGRFELRRLLGKSERSMLWLVHDPQTDAELMLSMPRVQPSDAIALQVWLADARMAARLAHPQLAASVEVGTQEHWPFIAYERRAGLTLSERLAGQKPPSPLEAAAWIGQALQGLAFAHEGGMAHRDLQPHAIAIDDHGRVSVLGLGVVSGADRTGADVMTALARSHMIDTDMLRAQRNAAESDVLALALVLFALLSGEPALDEPDVGRAMRRLPPQGREILRLPRLTSHPVPEPLRAIVNRAVGAQTRQRYRNARTLLRALDGWREMEQREGGGPIALLLDRLVSVGHLPALPGVSARAARLATMEKGRTAEMAELVLQDMALSFELLRNVNSAQVQGNLGPGSGPVLTLRRAILMLGLQGVRSAAAALRQWPGPLDEPAAAEMHNLMQRVRLAGQVAKAIRPAGFDAEMVFLVTLLQNLGRLVVQYHFPDEAGQIRQLMRTAPPDKPGDPEQPGLGEEAASYAVLGVDIEAMGAAVARQWGLTDEVLHMIRRLPSATPVRTPDNDDDLIRLTASCANEAVDLLELPAARQSGACEQLAHRYARSLHVTGADLQSAVQGVREQMLQHAHDEEPVVEGEPTIPVSG